MTRKTTLTKYGMGLFLATFLLASSGGPNFNTANAPGDGQYCGDCHAGGAGDASILLSGAPIKYAPGATYPMQLVIQDPTAAAGGFQIVATNGLTNTQIGTFSTPSGTKLTVGTLRLIHTAPKVFSSGAVAWTFNWTAPTSGAPANIQFYFAGNASNFNGNATGDDGIFGASGLIPLPVQLTKFEGKYKDDHSALISWETATELDAESFFLERSTDNRNFEVVTEIAAHGSTDQKNYYSFLDEKLEYAPVYYYRLAQRDFDGTEHRYQLITIRPDKSAVRVKYLDGMPALGFSNALRIVVDAKLPVATARLLSMDGREQGSVNITEGESQVAIPHDGRGGLHILQIFDESGRLVFTDKVL